MVFTMPPFVINYDPADVYQVVANLFYSFWPLIASVIGIFLAMMVMGGIITVFRRWMGHE